MHRAALQRVCRPCLAHAARPAARAPTLRRSFFWGGSGGSSTASSAAELASTHIPAVAPDLLPLLFGVALAHAAVDESQDEANLTNPPWEVKNVGAKGAGAFASRDIKRGELLCAERPLCCWPNGLSEEEAKRLFDLMSPQEQEVFMSLARTEDEGFIRRLDEIRARRATNGFTIPMPSVPGVPGGGKSVAMLFPKIARLNHSCTPNATQVMNFATFRMEIYAMDDIPQGTEINIEYLPGSITQNSDERRNNLALHFGFSRCLCAVCSASTDEVRASDERRGEIRRISNGIRAGRADRQGTMNKMERIRVLLEEEGYRALPEFSDENVTNSYRVFLALRARQQTQEQIV